MSSLVNQEGQILEAQPATHAVPVPSFGEKFGDKAELWRFLVTDAKIYLPHKKAVTAWFLGDLLSGKKKSKSPLCSLLTTVFCPGVLADDVKLLMVPRYESIKLEYIKARFFRDERVK